MHILLSRAWRTAQQWIKNKVILSIEISPGNQQMLFITNDLLTPGKDHVNSCPADHKHIFATQNAVDSDQLASSEANWSGSTAFSIQLMGLCQLMKHFFFQNWMQISIKFSRICNLALSRIRVDTLTLALLRYHFENYTLTNTFLSLQLLSIIFYKTQQKKPTSTAFCPFSI